MAKDLNKVQLIGNLGADPEIKVARESGKQLAMFPVATSDRWKDKGGRIHDRTEWHRVVVMGDNLVQIVKTYLKKGGKVYVEGSLRTRNWQTHEGEDRTTTEIIVQQPTGTLSLLDYKIPDDALMNLESH
ncbi:single-stranded DNA-binding protein [Tuwongella immobilis]|uniref:Single-stranded DNA-binding protein n=1 Tax=Tuwongella immobilis TaxID=692036 RepID=A0A6C2YV32_9BACT|nr:single-stranded DNA-binding protein [Tuwongella immobilis]VIP05304.1 single-stranded dna-binding protein : Single-stranded DNA-binding protein OS=Bartonella tamiae Th307 GN=MEG_01850 PE=4 SV=1: SSB [Tuwongella immobilis]VTS07964.1 single-stranded dna-binding protein : Single-stranded DNA-binding protein OS=Bartonella tamiae Th307 GN=MEG_01850 PE=4 SV=1: SSB [Tuwongella immobilis]